MVSDQAGRSNIMARFRHIGLEVDPKYPGDARRLEIVGSEFPFVLAGGIFRAVPWLEAELARRLPQASPRSRTIRLDVEPAAGAVRLALAEARGGYTVPAYKTD